MNDLKATCTDQSLNYAPPKSFEVDVSCKVVDQLGKQHDIDQSSAGINIKDCSYVKLVNVPTMMDINGSLPDPTDGALNLCMIDGGSLNLVNKFLRSNNLTQDMSHTNPTEPNSSTLAGNYYYDDDPNASDGGGEIDNRRILDNSNPMAAMEAGSRTGQSLNARVSHPNSIVNQLKKVLQAVHMSQRVVSSNI